MICCNTLYKGYAFYTKADIFKVFKYRHINLMKIICMS